MNHYNMLVNLGSPLSSGKYNGNLPSFQQYRNN